MSRVLEELVENLRRQAAARDAAGAVRRVLADSFEHRQALSDAIAATAEDEVQLFENDHCSIWSCRFRPERVMPPHEHRMPVHIACYNGAEVQLLYRRTGNRLEHAGNTSVKTGSVISLGPDAVHAVTAEPGTASHAIHVYMGPLMQVRRDLFDWTTGAAVDFTMENFHAMVRPAGDIAELRA